MLIQQLFLLLSEPPLVPDARVANPNYDADNSGKKKYRISHSIKIFR